MNIFNNKGFNFIEVIIAVVLISLIVASFSQLFSLSVDLPIVSDRSKALYYAQKEMEKLNNTPYDMISPLLRTNYPEDTNYDYEIKVKENSPQNNKKEVYIIFYFKDKPEILVDLYSEFIRDRIKLCEDFQDGNWNAPTWNWTRTPSGQWSLVQYPSGSGNYRAYYNRRQNGYIYPDWNGSSNYSVSIDFYIVNNSPLLNTFYVYLYGRYNNTTNNGYCAYVSTNVFGINPESYTDIILYRVINGNNQIISNLRLSNLNLFNSWHNLKLQFYNNRIKVYLDNILYIDTTDNQFTLGSIRIAVSSLIRNYNYFDNICVEETSGP